MSSLIDHRRRETRGGVVCPPSDGRLQERLQIGDSLVQTRIFADVPEIGFPIEKHILASPHELYDHSDVESRVMAAVDRGEAKVARSLGHVADVDADVMRDRGVQISIDLGAIHDD